MKSTIIAFACAATLSACASAVTPPAQLPSSLKAPDAPAVQVMVLGTYHMAGSTLDVVNMKVDNVLAPKRQEELQRIAEALAEFRPTAIALERLTDAPAFVDPKFADFDDEMLASNPNERVQIGYRLARLAGVSRVYGIDEQPSEGEPDYFPFGKLMAQAEQSGEADKLQSMIAEIQAKAAKMEDRLATSSIAEVLRVQNVEDVRDHGFYFRLSEFDVGEAQPGAELQAYWFMRNAKIFSKLMQVAEPGDRILVIYGGGHKYWLDLLARETPGYVLVDPAPYLERAAED